MIRASFELMIQTAMLIGAAAVAHAASPAQMAYPGDAPSSASAEVSPTSAVLKNNLLEISYQWDAPGLCIRFKALAPETAAASGTSPVTLTLAEGKTIGGADFQVQSGVKQVALPAQPDAHRLADRFAGWQLHIPMRAKDGSLEVLFIATLRDSSNYVTQQVSILSPQSNLAVDRITLLDLNVDGARIMGETQGAPIVAGPMFFAFENPMAESSVENGRILCGMQRGNILKAGTAIKESCAMGVTPPGQGRRGFLYYLERERAHPYRPFLHYNSWYDIAWGDRKFDEAQALEAITLFGENLSVKRGVTLQSFVFDDGWDDNSTLWQFHKKFPNGFTPLQKKATPYGSAVGTWLSPFGGYGQAREQRLAYGRAQGFETNDSGFSLAGPRYYDRFKAICEEMIRAYGVNFFKFDGMGAGLEAGAPGSRKYLDDIEALMRLTDELRDMAPDLYISATTGTWPSPFFLWHADNIWRGAQDMGFSGQGSKRQQWINYRDTWTYRNIVKKAPLYPLNALMTQGIVQAHHGMSAEMGDSLQEISDEIWSFFGSGTSLQELYIAPALLTDAQWDALAMAAAWSRANAAVLVDTHWIGGDPGENEIYGWASWTPGKAILLLRNPSQQNGTITLDPRNFLDLPQGISGPFRLSTPRPGQKPGPAQALKAGEPCLFALQPFEVLVFELIPEQ